MLSLRVRRILESPNAHAEMPATRSRRFVTNVRVEALGDDVLARSSVLLLRSRWDSTSFEFFAARRNDVLRRFGDELEAGAPRDPDRSDGPGVAEPVGVPLSGLESEGRTDEQ